MGSKKRVVCVELYHRICLRLICGRQKGLHSPIDLETDGLELIQLLVVHKSREAMIDNSSLRVNLSHMNEVVWLDDPLLSPVYLISVCSQYLAICELELHLLVTEKLPKHQSLEQINQYKGPLTQFDLDSIHLNLLFDPSNHFLMTVFTRM